MLHVIIQTHPPWDWPAMGLMTKKGIRTLSLFVLLLNLESPPLVVYQSWLNQCYTDGYLSCSNGWWWLWIELRQTVMCKCGIAGSYDKYRWNYQSVFQSGYTILHSHQQNVCESFLHLASCFTSSSALVTVGIFILAFLILCNGTSLWL